MVAFRFMFLLLLLAAAPPLAHGSEILALGTPTTFSYAGYTFTLGTCSYVLNNGAATGCSATNVELEITAARGTLTLTYLNVENAMAPLLSQASATGCTCLSLNLAISAPGGFSAVQAADTGFDQTGYTLDNWLSLGSSSTRVVEAGITQGGTSGYAAYTLPSVMQSVSLDLNLGVNGAYQPGVMSLRTASVTLTTVPEPAALPVFLAGAAALVVLRNRRRRSARTAPPPRMSSR